MGRLTLNVLLSFAQFEREIIGERTRDKLSAARRKGKWIGGWPVLGYDVDPKGGRLIVNPQKPSRCGRSKGLPRKLPAWKRWWRKPPLADIKPRRGAAARGSHTWPGR